MHLKRRLARVPCAVSVSCLQSIQHATGARNGFLQVTPSGRILENVDFHTGWWAHSAPCSAGGRDQGFTAVLPLADKTNQKKKKKKIWTPAQCQYVPHFANTYTNWWMCMYRDVSPTSQIRAEVRMQRGRSFWATYQETSEVIELHGVLNDYWSSSDDEFTILSQSLLPPSPHGSDQKDRSCCGWKVQYLSRSTILCKQYHSYLHYSPSLPANDLRVGRGPTLVTP